MNRPNMMRLAVTLAVVMISLLAPNTVARAAGNGPLQSPQGVMLVLYKNCNCHTVTITHKKNR